MWFGTDNGLARFDGRRVQNISPDGTESDSINTLKVSPTGDLWVGTRSGAFIYAGEQFRPVENTAGVGITAIYFGVETYLGTDNGLILQARSSDKGAMAAERWLPDALPGFENEPISVTGLFEKDGAVVASTSGRGAYSIEDLKVATLPTSAAPGKINATARSDDSIWIGTAAVKGASGVYRSTGPGGFERVPAPTSDVSSIEANDSGVWVGTERYGLFHFAGGKLKKTYTFENTSGGLRSNSVFSIFTDREGVIWIGTNRGVSRFDRGGAYQETVSDIPNSNFVRTICPSGEGFYAGSNRGLFRSVGEGKWREVQALRNRSIFHMLPRPRGSDLVGTSDGLFDTNGAKLLDGEIRGLAVFRSRQYAAVFRRGLVDITGDRPQQLVFPNEAITSIADASDRLLIGTNGNGLYSFDGKETKLEIGPETLKSGAIWKIEGKGADIWIAGQHGVFQITRDGPLQVISVEDVRDVLPIGEHLWAATTTQGLIHARKDERFGWLINSIGFEQGLPSEKAFSIKPIDGGMIIGTNRGVVTYKPGTVAPKLIPTRVLSQRAHDLAELASPITLEYPQNSLLVEVAGQSSRTFPEEFQYAFVLKNGKGDDVARQLSNDPEYAPAGLSPGDYSIEAIAFNRDLLASEPLVIKFSIAAAPFPWTATALGILLLLALIALAWAIYEHRGIKLRNRELAAARLDLANEAERERSRIARDLHDQTLADLRNLMIKSDKFGIDKGEFRNDIEAVSTEIRRICEDLSPSVLGNVGLVAALEFLLTESARNGRFSTSEDADEEVQLPMSVQLHIYRIAQEVLANIAQHSDADQVELRVEVPAAGGFVLQIQDNGKPFQPGKKVGSGRGISNIRSRANLINAAVDWRTGPDGGNIFSLSM